MITIDSKNKIPQTTPGGANLGTSLSFTFEIAFYIRWVIYKFAKKSSNSLRL